jgi:sterol desaturase/sphingolipid hydroxylase (fatty acid hydroxylase superfamily)
MIYKTFIEVSGHLGKSIKGGSFSQFVWLPKWLDIQMHSDDHYEHHVHSTCNFSKRFTLWDKIFGTYKPHE